MGVAAVDDHLDAVPLETGDDAREVVAFGVERFRRRRVYPFLDECRPGRGDDVRAVGRAVADERYGRTRIMLEDVPGEEGALHVVARHHAEDIGVAALGRRVGQLRTARRRRDHQDVGGTIDRCRGNRGDGAEMPHHDGHLLLDQPGREAGGALGVAGIVGPAHREDMAEQAALGVDVLFGLLHTCPQLAADAGVGAVRRPDHGDGNGRLGLEHAADPAADSEVRACREEGGEEEDEEGSGEGSHRILPASLLLRGSLARLARAGTCRVAAKIAGSRARSGWRSRSRGCQGRP